MGAERKGGIKGNAREVRTVLSTDGLRNERWGLMNVVFNYDYSLMIKLVVRGIHRGI